MAPQGRVRLLSSEYPRYRAGMALQLLGLRTAIYPVQDLTTATAWWTGLLGHGPYFDEPFYVGFDVAGYELALMPRADPADGVLTYWGVDDVPASVAQFVAAGAAEHMPAAEVGGGIVTATVRTPQASIVGLIFNPHFKAEPADPTHP